MTPIDYIDRVAYILRMKEYEHRGNLSRISDEFGSLALSMERSAEFFRQQDPSLPPRAKTEPVWTLYHNGDSTFVHMH